jgi:hypothetical protein
VAISRLASRAFFVGQSCFDSEFLQQGPGDGIDQDAFVDMVVGPDGVPTVAGRLSDGPLGQQRGFIARIGFGR